MKTKYIRNFYKNKSVNEIRKLIESEGFNPLPIHNSPGYTYHIHSHPETKIIAILEGSMDITVNDTTHTLLPDDRIVISGNTIHSAMVGPDGCRFFWSEKIISPAQ